MEQEQLVDLLNDNYQILRDLEAVTNERGSYTPEEKKLADGLVKQIHRIDESLDGMSATRVIRPDVGRAANGGRQVFRSFAEQLRAIREAGVPGGRVDPRLHQVRASGMSESVPADGGMLVETTFSREIFRAAFQTGSFAKLCREIPISGNSNTLKVNAIAESSRANGSRWGGLLGYWLSEGAQKQASRPKFRQMELTLKKLVVLTYATDELLEDADLLDSTLRQGFAEEIAFRIDDSILNGTGQTKAPIDSNVNVQSSLIRGSLSYA